MSALVRTAGSRPPTLDQVCEQALRLPCSPAILPKLTAVLMDPASSADDIADVIRIDSALAASTLRLANSAYFSSGGSAENISDAIMRLGQRELYRLAALALVNRWEGSSSRGEPGDFCRHALCTALAAEVLAEKGERVHPQTAYTAGLVCDLGKLAVAHACAPFFPTIREQVAQKGGTWAQAQRDILGYSHAEVGARLLKAWSFPAALATATEFCECPLQAPAEALPLLAHLHAGKYVATSFGPGVSEEGFFFELNTPFLLEWGFTPEVLDEALAVVHDRAKSRLHDKLTHGVVSM
ncbi:HDOD domain-containing protein [Horticoccus sp. 23ND18S-11]|uniref:HDOD domain-containing protein n=1 Tax=Horticoccus sp. 23ND18S-11 TaxID=3391832 RepID=UPI0039C97B80